MIFLLFQTDWSVWPVAQFINFYFLPPHYRVMYVNVVTTLYNVFLSHIKHKDMTVQGKLLEEIKTREAEPRKRD